jgi:TrpR-related protein YerC/YecD
MAQVSRYLMSDKIKTEINSLFWETISRLDDQTDIADFLEDFLSPTERTVLSKRLAIALMLKKDYSYQAIKKLLKVSQSTIADVNLKLKYSGKGYHKILDKVLKEQKINKIFDAIENFALKALTIGKGKGTGFWFDMKLKKQRETSSII